MRSLSAALAWSGVAKQPLPAGGQQDSPSRPPAQRARPGRRKATSGRTGRCQWGLGKQCATLLLLLLLLLRLPPPPPPLLLLPPLPPPPPPPLPLPLPLPLLRASMHTTLACGTCASYSLKV